MHYQYGKFPEVLLKGTEEYPNNSEVYTEHLNNIMIIYYNHSPQSHPYQEFQNSDSKNNMYKWTIHTKVNRSLRGLEIPKALIV